MWRDWVRAVDAGRERGRLRTCVVPRDPEPLSMVTSVDGCRHVNPTHMAEAFVRDWGVMWTNEEHGDRLDLLTILLDLPDSGPPLSPITVQEVQAAIRALPGRKASGLDHWTLSELKRLPEELVVSLCALFNRIEEDGTFPTGRLVREWCSCPKVRVAPPLSSGP